MKRVLGSVLVCLLLMLPAVLVLSTAVFADELSDMKAQMQEMKDEMRLMRQEIESLKAQRKAQQPKEAVSKENELVARVKALEENVAVNQETQDSLFKRVDEMVDIDVYATLELEDFKTTNSSFDAKNIELLLKTKMANRLSAGGEIEFERVAETSSGNRQGEVEVEQGWLEYYINNYIKPRFGVILVPFGRYNMEHFDPFQELTDRPIAMRRVVPTTWAEAGAGFNGTALLGKWLTKGFDKLAVNYQLYLINGLTDVITDSGFRNARGAFGSDSNNNKALVSRLGISPWPDQEVGLSSYFGTYDKSSANIRGFDLDWHFERKPFEVVGEGTLWNLQDGLESSGVAVPQDLYGGYVEGRYHFWFAKLNHTFLGRGFSNPTFTLVGRYDYAFIADDGDAGTNDNIEKRWTLGLNYRPVATWVFKLEYQNNWTTSEALERGDADGFIASVTAAF